MVTEPESTATGPRAARPASREAAVVVLYRRRPELSVFRVRRAPGLAYLGGFHAFPGGAVHAADASVPVEGTLDREEAARRVSAARELFEEVGVLLGRPEEGRSKATSPRDAPIGRAVAESDRVALRAQVDRGERPFTDALATGRVRLAAADFTPAGRWISPPFLPRAFDTYFYLAELPVGEEVGPLSGELDDGEWVTPERGLEEWRRGASLLATPVRRVFEVLLQAGERDDPAAWGAALTESREARGGTVERIEVTPGVVLVPLKTATLAPATHTNCLVLGEGECLLIDPGSGDPRELAALEAVLARLSDDGRRVTAISVTHHHGDHVGGVEALRRALDVPVLAHPLLAERLRADRVLEDGEIVHLEAGGGRPWRIEVRFSPGHTKDHVAFWEPSRGVLAAGDLVSGLSTVVVDPPDGNLGHYLASLEVLRDLPIRVLFPGHGPPTGGAHTKLEDLIRHRRWREDRVLAALGPRPVLVEELLPVVYEDVRPESWPLARRSLQAHLEHLEERRRVVRSGSGDETRWLLAAPSGS